MISDCKIPECCKLFSAFINLFVYVYILNLLNNVVYFSLYLYKLGIAPQIQDLLGKVAFTGNANGNQLLIKPSVAHKLKSYVKYARKCTS